MRTSRLLAHAALTLIVVVPTCAWSYIPKSETIANRIARGHGKGFYVVEQDVQFRTSTEPLVLRERWVIENGESMHLSVSSPSSAKTSEPIRYEVLYRANRRTLTDPIGGVKTAAMSPEFVEGFFHARTGKTILSSLVQSRIVPAAILHEKPKATKIEQIKHQPDPLIRLGRTAGVVAWILGEPSPAEGKLNPEAWVEQDVFNLRRLRFPSEAEVTADRYSSFPGSLRLPRERQVTWSSNLVTIRVVSVRPLSPAQIGRALDPSSISGQARLPDLAQVREFYTRFR